MNVLYPLSLIKRISVKPTKPVLVDNFDDGSEASRLIWPARTFKRAIQLDHAPLKEGEFGTLLSFVEDRDAAYDSFWFRDNTNRRGNILCRFDDGTEYVRTASPTMVSVKMHEIAATSALPGPAQIANAAGVGPDFWFDANRERYILHNGVVSLEGTLHDAAIGNYSPGGLTFDAAPHFPQYLFLPDNILQQYQSYKLGDYLSGAGPYVATYWTSANSLDRTLPFGAKTAYTLFCFANNNSTIPGLFGFGVGGSNTSLGLRINSGSYTPSLGGSEAYTNAVYANSPAGTWRSIAAVWAAGSNSVSLYVNGALIGTDSVSRAGVGVGPVTFGIAPGLSAFSNPNGDYLSNAMGICNACSLAQIKALHNLFCAQMGVAAV